MTDSGEVRAPAGAIFISYRREDSAGHSGRLSDALVARLGPERVFIDIDSVAPGEDFLERIEGTLQEGAALLVVIGRRWIEIEAGGKRRLDDPEDVVRREIRTALERELKVFPVLVDGASMPPARELPEDIRPVAFRNAIEITDTRWAHDCERLFTALKGDRPERGSRQRAPELVRPGAPRPLGREEQTEEILTLLKSANAGLVTVTGPGGVGKTSVVLEVVRRLREDRFRVLVTDLTKIRDSTHLIHAIAESAGVELVEEAEAIESIARALRSSVDVLVLDNFEHVLDAAPELASVMASTPDVPVLATSRTALRISGEHEYTLAPLELPAHASPSEIRASAAVRLFAERARAAQPGFELDDANAATVAEICRQLGGLPLAIELAAARLKLLGPDALLDRLDRQLKVLTHGAQDLPERQQTVRATIDWSYGLLAERERALLARLGVFTGGADLAALEAVCAFDRDPLEVLDSAQTLAENSLLSVVAGHGESRRFELLHVVREFALEKMAEKGEEQGLRHRHAEHFAEFAEQGAPGLESAQSPAWQTRFELEYPNLRAALAWARETGATELETRLTTWLGFYWGMSGRYAEGIEHQRRVLARSDLPIDLRAELTGGAGVVLTYLGSYAEALDLWEECRTLAERVGNERLLIRTALLMNWVYASLGRKAEAAEAGLRALERARSAGDEWRQACILNHLAEDAIEDGDLARAEELLDQQREISDRGGFTDTVSHGEWVRGSLLLRRGEPVAALSALVRMIEGNRADGSFQHAPFVSSLITASAALSQTGRAAEAAALLGTADAELEASGIVLDETSILERNLALEQLTVQLGEDLARAMSAGRDRSVLDALQSLIEAVHELAPEAK